MKNRKPKAESRSHDVYDTPKKDRSRSKSKTSESKTVTSSESKKHREKKSKSSADDIVSTKHHKSTKSSHSTEAEKHSRKSKREENEKEAPLPVAKIEPEQHVEDEYSYDFDYEDDFESDDEADDSRTANTGTKRMEENGISSTASSVSDRPATSKQEIIPSSPVVERTESTGNSQTDSLKNSREDIVEETPLLRRLATRQGGRPPDPAPPTKADTKQPSRIASAERRINFSNASVVNQSAIAQADERYRKLRELIGESVLALTDKFC
ncbi:hypothetical protein ANCCAN_01065 [Ancylostoma caninum]|uniref:Uncharacterized protein n=1 Tax=Ancylostoma caninum TaxID=29170 RepID=A0A368HAN7_ANCCA|nr:hypothetical protein ANCCAN_01065 [Ancylostoma caninum]